MRTEARALEEVLSALSGQIDRNHAALGQMAGDLMGLGDQAASRLGAVSAEFSARSSELVAHGAALDRAAENARSDIGVLLADLPEAEQRTLRMAETLRAAGQGATGQASAFQASVEALTQRTADADSDPRRRDAPRPAFDPGRKRRGRRGLATFTKRAKSPTPGWTRC